MGTPKTTQLPDRIPDIPSDQLAWLYDQILFCRNFIYNAEAITGILTDLTSDDQLYKDFKQDYEEGCLNSSSGCGAKVLSLRENDFGHSGTSAYQTLAIATGLLLCNLDVRQYWNTFAEQVTSN